MPLASGVMKKSVKERCELRLRRILRGCVAGPRGGVTGWPGRAQRRGILQGAQLIDRVGEERAEEKGPILGKMTARMWHVVG